MFLLKRRAYRSICYTVPYRAKLGTLVRAKLKTLGQTYSSMCREVTFDSQTLDTQVTEGYHGNGAPFLRYIKIIKYMQAYID